MTLLMYRSSRVDETERGRVRRLLFVLPNGVIIGGIENADDSDQIPTGRYNVYMIKMRTSDVRALWIPSKVVGVKQSQLCIHPANFADQLKGCAAPGAACAAGVSQSTDAMDRMFAALGGFVENRSVRFVCTDLRMFPMMFSDLRMVCE